jgi:hypothetical protein
MLATRDRRAGGPTAPPQGLFLQWIKTMDMLNAEELTAETHRREEENFPQLNADEGG